jgi:hypothetical protein
LADGRDGGVPALGVALVQDVLQRKGLQGVALELGLRERLSCPAARPFFRVRDVFGCSDGRLDAGGTSLSDAL